MPGVGGFQNVLEQPPASLFLCCRIQLCKGPPGGSVGQQCTAVLRASALLPTGLSVPFTLSTAGVAAEPEAAGGRPQPMQL